MPWSKKTVVFDLDGTLVDTAPDLHAALCHCFQEQGLRAVDLDTVRHAIGHGAKAMIESSAKSSGVTLDESTLTAMHKSFLAYYISHIADFSRPFEGMVDCLDHCQNMNANLAVCTNKTQALAEEVLDALGITHYFDAIIGADRATIKKPSPVHLQEAIAAAGGSVEDSVMIGDSSTDGLSALEAGVPFILMSYGYLDDKVSSLTNILTLDSAKKLPASLGRVFSQQD
ncbi:MAG: phosphoglycolate phosphatase [Ponticaulis sp.]|nr:phosphoglycolate phosphatase [Ponticaulis sp.]